jgi:hypothetical protein
VILKKFRLAAVALCLVFLLLILISVLVITSEFREWEKCGLERNQGCRVAVKPQEFSHGKRRQGVQCAQGHCYEETSCIPAKDAVISFALLVVAVKLLGRIIDLLFDLLGMNSQCATPHSKETINTVVTVYLLSQAVLLLGMSLTSIMKIAFLFVY